MIPARNTPWLHLGFEPFVRILTWWHLHGVYFLNLPPALPHNQGVLLCPNHHSWWDGFLPYLVARRYYRRPYYVLGLGPVLRMFPPFRYLGAFAVEPGKPESSEDVRAYIPKLLAQKPPPLVGFFPQGRIQPDAYTEYAIKSGIARLPIDFPVQVLPVHIRTEALNHRLPTVFFRFGELLDYQQEVAYQPERMVEELSRQRELALEQLRTGDYGRRWLGRKLVPILGT